jgi:hypothetical protein
LRHHMCLFICLQHLLKTLTLGWLVYSAQKMAKRFLRGGERVMTNAKKPELIKQTPKGFMMRVKMMVEALWKKKEKQDD